MTVMNIQSWTTHAVYYIMQTLPYIILVSRSGTEEGTDSRETREYVYIPDQVSSHSSDQSKIRNLNQFQYISTDVN